MIEPDPSNFTILQKCNPECCVIYGAIAQKTEGVYFNQAENIKSHNWASGSIRKPTGHLKHFPEVEFKNPIYVPGYALDFIARGLSRIDLLWCDIQGAERDMIEGGRATLRKTRYMMIEAEPEVELYEGQALKPELLAMLPDWEIIKDFGYNLLMSNREYRGL
jgi:FkbM family methyltransferase